MLQFSRYKLTPEIRQRVMLPLLVADRRSSLSQKLMAISGLLLLLTGCGSTQTASQVPNYCPEQISTNQDSNLTLLQSTPNLQLLRQSWLAYRQRFIQADGRVINREEDDRSSSEGQSYAMLRAVFINDYNTFARTLTWAENNLARKDAKGVRTDQFWAKTWGKSEQKWEILNSDFASNGDVDAATALILAARRWNCPGLLVIARKKVSDLWKFSTITANGKRYLKPGLDTIVWNQPSTFLHSPSDTLLINPSYFSPFAFRLFAQVDREHNWNSLVDSSYQVLEAATTDSKVGLPSNWLLLDTATGKFSSTADLNIQQSLYGFDAHSIWWRLALDAAWFKEARAEQYLQRHTAYLKQLWQKQQKIPAQIDLQGKPISDNEVTSHYASLYAALQLADPAIAQQIYQRKLISRYKNGFWNNDSAYYSQNLTWFALLPPTPPTQLLQGK